LLTNDGTLPLNPIHEVAVFGRCQLDWFYMGYGSGGNVNPPHTVNLMEGLANAHVRYNHVLAEMYRTWCTSKEHEADLGWWGHWPTHHPEMPVDASLAQAAARTADTAIVVIGRCTGEDLDLPLAPGGYYLTNDERQMLAAATSTFAHTVAVLNIGNAIDLSWIEEFDSGLSAVLVAWQGGMEAGNAVADVLFGKVNPSGRLSCTVARTYNDHPSSTTFGKKGQVDYTEGVFVGYRYFDAHAPGRALFSLGHGLSYTSFDLEITSLERADLLVTAKIRVTNTGTYAGKRAVLLWCEPPQGTMEKPVRVLAAFAKTQELAPGASEVIDIVCNLADIATFDESSNEFVLEPGGYQFGCTGTVSSIELERPVVVQRCHTICTPPSELRKRIEGRLPLELVPVYRKDVSFDDVAQGKSSADGFVAQLNNEELRALTHGEGTMNSPLGTTGNAGSFGGVTPRLRELGVPAAICADGPSGGRLQRTCSLLPCATALACTWDSALVEALYHEVGNELRENGVDVLLAPGMNIQRDPRCGRNFEYFSEDPVASGHMAASVVRGLQGAGVSACPKHFACNNQEERRNTSDSHVDERTLREVYLRGFQICLRESSPDLIMTSYNKVNGVWAHYSFDLATTVLRDEWGFEGVIITDWWMKRARSPEFPELRDNAYRVRAGVDVLMPGSMTHVGSSFGGYAGITRAELQQSATRVIAFLARRARSERGKA
jgi:beta-glucosidase